MQMHARMDWTNLWQRRRRMHPASEDLRQWHLQEREGIVQVLLHTRIHRCPLRFGCRRVPQLSLPQRRHVPQQGR